MLKNTVLGLILTTWIAPTVWAESIDEIKWGLMIEEKIHFDTPEACDAAVRQALVKAGFEHIQTGMYEQGPTIFGRSLKSQQKSLTKCLLNYDLLMTTVIGEKNNLVKATLINKAALAAKDESLNITAQSGTALADEVAETPQRWQLQVGAFESIQSAEQLVKDLDAQQVQSEIQRREQLWRVMVPAQPVNKDQAEQLMAKLKLLKINAILKPVDD